MVFATWLMTLESEFHDTTGMNQDSRPSSWLTRYAGMNGVAPALSWDMLMFWVLGCTSTGLKLLSTERISSFWRGKAVQNMIRSSTPSTTEQVGCTVTDFGAKRIRPED